MSAALCRVSLGLNLVLAIVAVALFLHRPSQAHAPAPLGHDLAATAKAQTLLDATRVAADHSASAPRRSAVDRLRALGVPNRVLAQVAQADIDVNWERECEKLGRNANPERKAALQVEHEDAKLAAMLAALGEEGFRQWDRKKLLREAINGRIDVTSAEADALYDLKRQLRARQSELEKARVKGAMDDAAIEDASYKIYCEFNDRMKVLLGDERYARSQGSDDASGATNLRQELGRLDPNPDQLQSLLKAQRQWNARLSDLERQFQDNEASSTYDAAIAAVNEERDREYKRVLGAEAFESLQKRQDAGYSKMKQYQDLWGLDDGQIDYVYGTLKYYEKSVADYSAQNEARAAKGESVDWGAVTETLQEFSSQIQQSLQKRLGGERFDRLQRNRVIRLDAPSAESRRPQP